jgi:hypothetical protein
MLPESSAYTKRKSRRRLSRPKGAARAQCHLDKGLGERIDKTK